MVQIEMNKPSACRWTDEEDSIHLCPFLDSEYECILQGRIGYWSWGGQYKNCPLHEVTEDSDTISREAVINAINSLHDKPNAWLDCAVEAVESLPSSPTPNRPHGQWILCSERLPEGTVLATVETKMFKHKYICEAVWIPRWSKIADFDSWEDCSEYNEDEDEYYVLEGWYERIHNWDEYSFVGIEDKVIAWKPLPEPYNKVEKGT